MDIKVKQKWLTALNSGKYEQTKGRLKGKTGFCCLGVLCDLYAEEHPESDGWDDENRTVNFSVGYTNFYDADRNFNDCVLTPAVKEWAGLTYADPAITPVASKRSGLSDSSPRDSLARANDSGYNFLELSQIIRREF